MHVQARPAEPIVCCDDIDPKDAFALEAPFERAIDVLKNAYADDPVCSYFARPGQERDYMCGLMETLRQDSAFQVYEAGSFSAVALVRDTAEEGLCKAGGPEPDIKDPQALKDLLESGDPGPTLATLGFSHYEAGLLQHIRPEAVPAYVAYKHDTRRLLQEYAKQHGCQVLYIQFLGVEQGQRHHGLGSRLMHHITAAADAEGKHLWAEATRPESKRMLEGRGFKVWRECQVGGSEGKEPLSKGEGEPGPVVAIMARPPVGGKSKGREGGGDGEGGSGSEP